MRILLAQNALYYPAFGGGDRSNRLLMEALAERGHQCRVVARIAQFGDQGHEIFLRELAARMILPVRTDGGVVVFRRCGVEAHIVTHHPSLRAYLATQIAEFSPDVILASTDDPAQVLLEVALRSPARTVYLARATLALPFGPDCAFPSTTKTDALRRTDAVVGVSRYVAAYVRKYSGIPATHVPISLLDPPPFPDLGRFDNEFVTLVNPCAVKGISIFLDLADRLPALRFAAVPTWGTTAADRAALSSRANVTMLDPVDNIDEILRRTRVLLVPSLWAEARSRIVVDAMLRGIPVIASNVGGIPEAKLGLDYLLPVHPIERYGKQVDEQMVPVAEVPPQDTAPWKAALERLISDRTHYESLSRASREAALDDAARNTIEPFEALLARIVKADLVKPLAQADQLFAPTAAAPELLSRERRQLLSLRLRRSAGFDPIPPGTLRLFCFPHAGGGAAFFRRWAEALPHSIAVAPVRPRPGKRPDTMSGLVTVIFNMVQPFVDEPFAFFGHSMGAAVAFELARLLRRRDQPLPRILIASGARAPHFRRGHIPPPEPSDLEFIDALRSLDGTPREVLNNPKLLEMVLPALRDDAAIYRNYIYLDEPPLACPIRAYGGADDPNVRREHLEAWATETSSSFGIRIFPGGHFYLQAHEAEFLRALAADLQT